MIPLRQLDMDLLWANAELLHQFRARFEPGLG